MKTPEEKVAEEAEEEEIASQMASLSVPEDLPTLMKSAKTQSQSPSQSKTMNSIMKMESVNLPEPQSTQSQTMIPGIAKLPSTTMSTATPPVQSMDQMSQKRRLSQIQAGGSLYASLASTAYQLAPPAVLLGIAAATLRKRRGRKGKKSRKI
jgi:carbohydrate-binding DOMON domain-containing protein